MRKHMIVPVLLLSLLLVACGGREAGSGRNLFWDALDMDGTETVLVVDGREVQAWRYCWWLTTGRRAMEEACADGGLTVDWDGQLEEGTLGEYVEAQALEDTVLYAAVENLAENWGAVLSAEPTGAGVSADSDMPLEAWQRQELEAVGLLYGELCAMAAAEDSPLVTREELAVFAAGERYLTLDRIVFPMGGGREAARKQAEEAFARLNNAGNKDAVFSALSAAGGSAEPVTVQAGDGTLEPGLVSAAMALEVGQYSGILEGEKGFYILRRLEPDLAAMAPVWVERELLKAVENAVVEKKELFSKLTISATEEAVSANLGGIKAKK